MTKKQEIISIVRDVIHSKGYQATSISDVLHAAKIGKGQFYHYFSSKHDLGLAVVEDLVQELDNKLILDILQTSEEPVSKLNNMLDWFMTSHTEMERKLGCPIGNLAIEMSEHDEEFRVRIAGFFDRWFESVEEVLNEMKKNNQLEITIDTKKSAQTMMAMIQGGILLMKNQQNNVLLNNVFDCIRKQFNLI
ncbi:TetR/AcrR family transcriptional regulator [Lysinibacillus sp. NPDC097287]|uniref:TetR/AcrR family transcriptional regulator n=1 Tax=Lysinibacillus sp. NPDC097287 TaxID=3364144 RepID=UPI0037F8DFCE